MPIHDLGYRAWTGRVTPTLWRWWVIAASATALAWKNAWLRRIALVAWAPGLYFGVVFFAYESWVQVVARGGGGGSAFKAFLENSVSLPQQVLRDPEAARPEAWAYLFHLFFSRPMLVVSVLVAGLIAPPLVANDLRSRAFVLYFSRPITRLEYLLGKATVIWTYVGLTAVFPVLVLYAAAVLLSPSFAVAVETWTLPLRTLAAGVLLLLPAASLALMFSSLTLESRYASFAWFATWILGFVTFMAYRLSTGTPFATSDAELVERSPWLLASLFHTLGIVIGWIFGIETEFEAVIAPLLVVVAVTATSFVVLYRRISSPMKV